MGEDRKQINCVVETVAMGKAKAGQRDVALKKHSCLSILNVFINHQKSIWLMLVVAIVEEHFIMITGPIPQEDINVYVSKNRVLQYMKQNLLELQGQIENSTIIAGDFISSLSINNGRNTKTQERYTWFEHYQLTWPINMYRTLQSATPHSFSMQMKHSLGL